MVRHLLLLQLKEGSAQEKRENARRVKEELEALVGVIPGLERLEVVIDPLEGSNRDLLLDSLFESQRALTEYQAHPAHQKAAVFVRSVVRERICFDYEESGK